MSDLTDIIQLGEDAVRHLLPSYATEDDMYDALDRCGMTVKEIYDELEARMVESNFGKEPRYSDSQAISVEQQAGTIIQILYDRFDYELRGVIAHKVPIR